MECDFWSNSVDYMCVDLNGKPHRSWHLPGETESLFAIVGEEPLPETDMPDKLTYHDTIGNIREVLNDLVRVRICFFISNNNIFPLWSVCHMSNSSLSKLLLSNLTSFDIMNEASRS